MSLPSVSQTHRAVLVRATASFVYLLVFSLLPKEWWSMGLMWIGLIVLRWVDSKFPWNSNCAKCSKGS